MTTSGTTSLARAAGIAAIAGLMVACDSGSSTGGFDVERSFTIPLTTTEEVPTPKPSTASGSAEDVIYPQEIEYRLTASSIMNVTAAHNHVGPTGVAGPIAVFLFSSATGGPGPVSGQFARGTITANSTVGIS